MSAKFGRREMRPTEEELVQLREWHAQYEAQDDLDACLRGYGALVARLEGELAAERAAHDATARRADRWQEVAANTEKRVLAEIQQWLEAHS